MKDRMLENEKVEGIVQFFSGKSVFLTGVTGFLGSCIAEKLLRSCPGIKSIFVLIRVKKGTDVNARLTKVTSSPLFDHVRQNLDDNSAHNATDNNGRVCSSPLSKLVPISGDMALPQLGLSSEDIEMLSEQVLIVIHSAATVKFNDPLKVAAKVNLEGTQAVLQLAKKMKNLESLVHISTAYSNCDRKEIKEVIYPTKINPLLAVQIIKSMSDEDADFHTPMLLGKKPNTYVFTKHLAENLVAETAIKNNLPVCIVRPSMVTAAEKEPFPGWIENFNGPSGAITAVGTGIVHSILCYEKLQVDYIPIDHVCHLVIAAAWDTARTAKDIKNLEKSSSSKNSKPKTLNSELVSISTAKGSEKSSETFDLTIPIYNSCSGAENPTTFQDCAVHFCRAIWKHPFHQMLCFPSFDRGTASTPAADWMYHTFFRKIPFSLLDMLCRTLGKPAKFLKTYRRVKRAIRPVEFFLTHEFAFSTSNTKRLFDRMTWEDQETFNFDIAKLNWPHYYENYLMGLGKFALKQDPKGDRAARRKIKIFYVVHRLIQTVRNYLILRFLNFGLKKWLNFRVITNKMMIALTILRTVTAHLKMTASFRKYAIIS